MISTRFVPALCVLTLLALVPTLIHSYSRAVEVDGRQAAVIPSSLAGFSGAETGRRPNWGMRRFESDDWIERTYVRGPREVRLAVVRSYDAKRLYHHPELAVADEMPFGRAEVEYLPGRPDLPIHVLRPGAGTNAIALYALHHGDEFVGNPIAFQIRNAAELLFSRRRPMTMFFVTQSNVPAATSIESIDAATVLTAAVDTFLDQPQPQ